MIEEQLVFSWENVDDVLDLFGGDHVFGIGFVLEAAQGDEAKVFNDC